MSDILGNVTKSILVALPEPSTNSTFLSNLRYSLIEQGFIIVREESRVMNVDLAARLFEPSHGFYSSIGSLISQQSLVGTVHVVLVARSNAAEVLIRTLTESNDADTSSDSSWTNRVFIPSEKAAYRAVQLMFPKCLVVDPIPANEEANEYIHTELNQLLVEGITEVAKQKPKNPIEYLAHFLLRNNPRSPPLFVENCQ